MASPQAVERSQLVFGIADALCDGKGASPGSPIKGFRPIFSRFEKLDVMFVGFILFALIVGGVR